MRNYLTIAGVDSRDFGVYISGQGTFSAPEKAYQFYNVPGRNGAILGNDHRLENIEVSYECFIYSNFNQNIADFRTFLLSLDGYQKLTDSYHPDEYRMAVYTGPFEPEVTQKNDAGSFTLIFNCKPQRWLISGDTSYGWVNGGSQEVTGEELTVFGPALDDTVFTGEFLLDGGYVNRYVLTKDGEPILTLQLSSLGVTGAEFDFIAGTWELTRKFLPCRDDPFTHYSSSPFNVFKSNSSYTNLVSWYGGQIHGFSGYRKIDPESTEYDTALKLNNYSKAWTIFNDKVYIQDAAHKSMTGGEFGYYLAANEHVYIDLTTPVSYSFTPISISDIGEWVTFSGQIVQISTSLSNLTMKYAETGRMSNPTMFPSRPLIRVEGTGTFTMDGVTVTIADCNSYVDIDCELMDCYEGSINRNKDVTFSTYDFPLLRPGNNEIEIISGITSITITPRWWRV